jgi:non-specific serine/threonine protein kinase
MRLRCTLELHSAPHFLLTLKAVLEIHPCPCKSIAPQYTCGGNYTMSKAYSNKALPRGTILREWRLEEVLGVGGFGIVYKARGIYFNELVAIKEYFPSAISERDDNATVVPVDSDAEEVHALGLKKFVEEAKLLWNLSSPSRHPNIVSVRSLFEVHGTAYMVMDFEDGNSLSKLLKNGVRFNESSLKEMVIPMAEGLERAHRVGVLHRDIKPPNIILNDSGRPVLIDFGSARFESGEATSTTVTFHTPPYAAIEQYVKTFQQGPWTDIYALGVVLYECVTGTKPLEVLERMHGHAGTPLAEGNWPGYSKAFLAAIDKAMMVRPEDRPRAISEWLSLLDPGKGGSRPDDDDDDDEDVTRIMTFSATAEGIVPVAPPPPGFGTGDLPASSVPADPKDVQFKKAGNETDVGKKAATEAEAMKRKPPLLDKAPDVSAAEAPATSTPEISAPEASATPAAVPAPAPADNKGNGNSKAPSPKVDAKGPAAAPKGRNGKILLIGGALVLAIGAGWMVFGGGSGGEIAPVPTATQAPVIRIGLDGLAPALKALAADAREAGVGTATVEALESQVTSLEADTVQLAGLPEGGAATQLSGRMTQAVVKAAADFTTALVTTGQQQVASASRTYPWASPSGNNQSQNSAQRRAAQQLRTALQGLQTEGAAATGTDDPSMAVAIAHRALEQSRVLGAAIAGLSSVIAGAPTASGQPTPAAAAAEPRSTTTATSSPAPTTSAGAAPAAAPQAPVSSASRGVGASAAQRREISRIVDRADDVARDVIRLEQRNRPGANATEQQREGYRIRQADAQTAREYQTYLQNLEASLVNVGSSAEADRMIQQANQTLGYLRELLARSNATMR